MSKAFDEIQAGLTDAIQHSRGRKSKVVEHTPENKCPGHSRIKGNEPGEVLRGIWHFSRHVTSLGASLAESQRRCPCFAKGCTAQSKGGYKGDHGVIKNNLSVSIKKGSIPFPLYKK